MKTLQQPVHLTFHPVCYMNGIIRSMQTGKNVSGHTSRCLWRTELNEGLMCEVCGNISIGWFRQDTE